MMRCVMILPVMIMKLNEAIAKFTLTEILGWKQDNLLCSDKPDIQDDNNDIGIEVVQDFFQKDKEVEAFWEKNWGIPLTEIPKKNIERFESMGGTIGAAGIISFGQHYNIPQHLKDTIAAKLDLLNKGKYKQFANFMLYVIVDTVFLFDSYVLDVMRFATSTEHQKKFHMLFLDGISEIGSHELVVCDLSTQTFERHPITKGQEKIIISLGQQAFDTSLPSTSKLS